MKKQQQSRGGGERLPLSLGSVHGVGGVAAGLKGNELRKWKRARSKAAGATAPQQHTGLEQLETWLPPSSSLPLTVEVEM